MAAVPTQAELMDAIEALRPDQEQTMADWYIQRRELVVRRVLDRAGEPDSVVPAARTPRKRRRTLLAGGLAVALLGGGTAWAYTNYTAWYPGGALDGFTCMTTWHEPDLAQRPDQYGGVRLTTDPIADCERYAELTGKPKIVDPVVATYRDYQVVGPRSGMPADATLVTDPNADPTPSTSGSPSASPSTRPTGSAKPSRNAAKEMELQNSFDDYVDGAYSRCLDRAAAEQFARDELARLGLTGWTLVVLDQEDPETPCTGLFVGDPGEVHVRLHFQPDATLKPRPLVTTLRDRIVDQCVGLAEAKRIVERALEAERHYQPTSAQLDPAADCTRVDLVIAGSLQVFLRGPAEPKR